MKLTVRDAFVGYDQEKPLQKYVNFTVMDGDVCCILGPNGCGKSTLVKTILGMVPLLQGSITVDGSDVTQWSAARLSEKVAYVAQRHEQSFPFQVRDVVMLGRLGRTNSMSGKPSKRDYNIVENAMADMGILHLADRAYSDISGGELQLVMFARAIAQEPELLIMDEPTAALDYGNAVRVIEKVRELADAGYGVLMVTHNPDHAFMTGANVALFMRNRNMIFGDAFEVITRHNIQDAYGINVKLVEFTHDNDEVMRMCAPEFGGAKRRRKHVPAEDTRPGVEAHVDFSEKQGAKPAAGTPESKQNAKGLGK